MRTNPYENYLETEILTADPLKLVIFLYRGALDSIVCARRHLAAGDIRARSQAISKTMAIVAELISSLDPEAGGQFSINLARLYAYILTRLTEANVQQTDPPLAEVENLMGGLLQSWQTCHATLIGPAEVDAEQPSESERLSCAY